MAERLLDPVHRDVARMFGVPTSVEQRILAGVMATGPGSVASHRSSARLWGAERPDLDPVDVILPGRHRRSRVAGVVVHRPRDLDDLRPVMRGPVPVTNPLRTLLDLGAVDPLGVPAVLRSFVLSGYVTPAAGGRHVGSARGEGTERGPCVAIRARPLVRRRETNRQRTRDPDGGNRGTIRTADDGVSCAARWLRGRLRRVRHATRRRMRWLVDARHRPRAVRTRPPSRRRTLRDRSRGDPSELASAVPDAGGRRAHHRAATCGRGHPMSPSLISPPTPTPFWVPPDHSERS